jgi:ABC-type branched-subunit amino acid transport system substrate-binding protein
MGPFVSTLTAVAAPLAQAAGINTFMWSAVSSLMNPAQDRLYSTAVTLDQMATIQAKIISQLSREKPGLKVFITRLDSAAGVDFSKVAKAEIAKRDWQLMGEQKITTSATNVSDQAAAMAESGAEYCLCATFGAPNLQLMRALRSNGSKMVVVNYFGGGFASDLMALKDPNYYAVLNYVDPTTRDLPAASLMRIRASAAGQQKYMNGYAFTQGYVAGMIFTQALENCGPSCTPDKFRKALETTEYKLGNLAGPTSLDKSQYLVQSGRAFYFSKGRVVSAGDWQTAS